MDEYRCPMEVGKAVLREVRREAAYLYLKDVGRGMSPICSQRGGQPEPYQSVVASLLRTSRDQDW